MSSNGTAGEKGPAHNEASATSVPEGPAHFGTFTLADRRVSHHRHHLSELEVYGWTELVERAQQPGTAILKNGYPSRHARTARSSRRTERARGGLDRSEKYRVTYRFWIHSEEGNTRPNAPQEKSGQDSLQEYADRPEPHHRGFRPVPSHTSATSNREPCHPHPSRETPQLSPTYCTHALRRQAISSPGDLESQPSK